MDVPKIERLQQGNFIIGEILPNTLDVPKLCNIEQPTHTRIHKPASSKCTSLYMNLHCCQRFVHLVSNENKHKARNLRAPLAQ